MSDPDGPPTQRHDGNAGLCEEDHWCPNCENFVGTCIDLFIHPICGLVACATEEDADDEEFCPACFAGMESSEHLTDRRCGAAS